MRKLTTFIYSLLWKWNDYRTLKLEPFIGKLTDLVSFLRNKIIGNTCWFNIVSLYFFSLQITFHKLGKHLGVRNVWVTKNFTKRRPVVPGCAMAHSDFGRSVKPISTRGDRLCPPNYYWHTRIFRPCNSPESVTKTIPSMCKP